MTTVIETDELPADERFAFWREEVVPQTWVPMEIRTDDRAGFRARLRSTDLGVIQVNLITTTQQSVHRTPRMIRRSAPDLLKIVVALGGRGQPAVMQDERQAHLRPGDFALYDTTRPFEVLSVGGPGPARALTLHFPRSLLPLPDGQLRRLTAVPMRADMGIGKLTSDLLMQLAAGADTYSPAEAARLSTAALEVLTTRLAHELDDGAQVPLETRHRALLARIHAFIQEHLGDPELSPRSIAAAHHISLRYLHKLFQEEGETVASWIRTRRLEGCRRDLADPTQAHRPVAAIAARWGLPNPGHFSRAFKAAYGMPPQTYRRWALEGRQARPALSGDGLACAASDAARWEPSFRRDSDSGRATRT